MFLVAVSNAQTAHDPQAFNLDAFHGFIFGTHPENTETNVVRMKLEMPYRSCTHVCLGYTDYTHKLCSVSLEGDLEGWSFSAITNEAAIVKELLETRFKVPLKRMRYGTYTFSNDHISVTILSLFKTPIINATLQKSKSNYFCIRVKRNDLIEDSARAKKESVENLQNKK